MGQSISVYRSIYRIILQDQVQKEELVIIISVSTAYCGSGVNRLSIIDRLSHFNDLLSSQSVLKANFEMEIQFNSLIVSLSFIDNQLSIDISHFNDFGCLPRSSKSNARSTNSVISVFISEPSIDNQLSIDISHFNGVLSSQGVLKANIEKGIRFLSLIIIVSLSIYISHFKQLSCLKST